MYRIFIIVGVIFIIIGLLGPFLSKIGLGRLPGDFYVKGSNFSFYFPITTCIIVSVIISIVLWIFNR